MWNWIGKMGLPLFWVKWDYPKQRKYCRGRRVLFDSFFLWSNHPDRGDVRFRIWSNIETRVNRKSTLNRKSIQNRKSNHPKIENNRNEWLSMSSTVVVVVFGHCYWLWCRWCWWCYWCPCYVSSVPFVDSCVASDSMLFATAQFVELLPPLKWLLNHHVIDPCSRHVTFPLHPRIKIHFWNLSENLSKVRLIPPIRLASYSTIDDV